MTHRNRSGDEIYSGIELECTICGEVTKLAREITYVNLIQVYTPFELIIAFPRN